MTQGQPREEQGLDLNRLIAVVLRRWWLFVLISAVVVGGVLYFESKKTPIYKSRITLLVRQGQTGALPTLSEIELSARLTDTYNRIMRPRPILDEVVKNLDLPYEAGTLASKISSSAPPRAQLIDLTASDSDPIQAQRIANEVANVFIDTTRRNQLAEIARIEGTLASLGISNTRDVVASQLATLGSLTVVEPASLPGAPVDTGFRTDLIVFLILGLLVASGIVVLLEYLDDTVKSPEDVRTAASLNTLGIVSMIKGTKEDPTSRLVTLPLPAPEILAARLFAF